MPQTVRNRYKTLVWGVFVLVATCAVLELGARAVLHFLASPEDFEKYASTAQLRARFGAASRFQVHRHLGFSLTPGYQRYNNRHNSLGFRGEEFAEKKAPGVLRIVCAGGSTTYGEGVVAEYRLSYPHILQHVLRGQGLAVEVINAGCPGWTTLETLINFQTRVLPLEPDVLIVYEGINDAISRIVWPPEAYRGDHSGWLCRREAIHVARFWESSTLVRYLLARSGAMEPHGSMVRIIGDVPPTSHTFEFRRQRNGGRYPDGVFREVPIDKMLAANPPVFFERNLRSLIAMAKAHGVRLVLMTFAISKAFPAQSYVGHPAIQKAIAEMNEIQRQVATETAVPLFDFAKALPDDPSLFTDGMHFTAPGNVKRVELLLAWLRDHLQIGK
jgi:lysophospholipase L1-like esterase